MFAVKLNKKEWHTAVKLAFRAGVRTTEEFGMFLRGESITQKAVA